MPNGKNPNNNLPNNSGPNRRARRNRRARKRQTLANQNNGGTRASQGDRGGGRPTRPDGTSLAAANISRPRNPTSIINSLASGFGSMYIGNPYLHCRLNPFTGEGRTPIPDGKNSAFVVIDTMTVDTIVCSQAGTGFTIQTLPCLPAMAALRPDPSVNLVVNGLSITAPANINPGNVTAANASYPIAIPTPYLTVPAGPGTAVADPYSATKARLVSVGYRLIYTGPALTCSGAVVVTPNDVALSLNATATSASNPPTGTSFSLLGEDRLQVPNYTAPIGTPILSIDINNPTTTMNRESVTYRPEQGVLILPKHKTSDFKIQPLFTEAMAIVANFNTNVTMPAQFRNLLTTSGVGYNGGIIWYDNDWSSLMIRVTGANADASFRLETISCIEYTPNLSSAFAPTTAKSSPYQPKVLEEARTLTANLPAALPLSGRPR